MVRFFAVLSWVSLLFGLVGLAPMRAMAGGLHRAPIIISARQIKQATNFTLGSYRLFRTASTGEAVPIPFQIDELNEYGDYILDQDAQSANPGERSNGIFDNQDELAFMGEDVGLAQAPVKWPGGTPELIFEIRLKYPGVNPAGPSEGAVYLGVFFRQPPAVSDRRYVIFNQKDGEVLTSRYRYQFDRQNYLVVRGVDMIPNDPKANTSYRLLDSSTFYIKTDLKYFLTLEVNHHSIRSQIEAFKIGPVRTVVRVTFFYSILKLNFELGMYTEVSFFSNSVVLPAVLYNPLDGPKSLNAGSGFYYGFALTENPGNYEIDTNMPAFHKTGLLDFLKSSQKEEPLYWISAHGSDRMMYVEIAPSPSMQKAGIHPSMYLEKIDGRSMASRSNDIPKPLGESPVNMGLYFDLTKFTEGEHIMSFRLFFENRYDAKQLESFRTLNQWQLSVKRL